jgi:phosphoglycolate phosphatase-like HAD superfamily hydrolase
MRVALLIMLVLAVSYSQQAQGVCVFDLDGTLIGVKNTSLSRMAVKACEDAGYKLAVNTAEPSGLCAAWRVIQNAPRSGVSYGENVPKKMWMCRG